MKVYQVEDRYFPREAHARKAAKEIAGRQSEDQLTDVWCCEVKANSENLACAMNGGQPQMEDRESICTFRGRSRGAAPLKRGAA